LNRLERESAGKGDIRRGSLFWGMEAVKKQPRRGKNDRIEGRKSKRVGFQYIGRKDESSTGWIRGRRSGKGAVVQPSGQLGQNNETKLVLGDRREGLDNGEVTR